MMNHNCELKFPDNVFINGFCYKYYKEIQNVINGGNSDALEQLIKMYISANGFYAEEIEDIIYTIFKTKKKFIANNWNIISKYQENITFETTSYGSEESQVMSEYKSLDIDAKTKDKILEFLTIQANKE